MCECVGDMWVTCVSESVDLHVEREGVREYTHVYVCTSLHVCRTYIHVHK